MNLLRLAGKLLPAISLPWEVQASRGRSTVADWLLKVPFIDVREAIAPQALTGAP